MAKWFKCHKNVGVFFVGRVMSREEVHGVSSLLSKVKYVCTEEDPLHVSFL